MSGVSSGPASDGERELQTRMLRSGEWERIFNQLKQELNESGWTDIIMDRAREECRQAPSLSVRTVERNVANGAQALISADTRAVILEEIRQFIEDNLRREPQKS
ncbi:hypothetical protein DL93DRAFT_2077092 [Clavulina sp. PMI_390]|nr:hypothetical protein DL93DRAFT_2077092 [Clavulina sp. PMI_390]